MAQLILALAAAASIALPSAASSQTNAPGATFRSGIEAVTVSASVRDRHGRPVTDLGREDFVVVDEGEREIRDFRGGSAAISLAVVLDSSGSMAVGGNMDRARRAVRVVLSRLESGRDEAGLFTFDSELRETHAFSSDLERMKAASLAGTPWGPTSLFDAIAHTAPLVANRPNHHRAVMVITDGIDTGSRLTASEVSGVAGAIDVPVFLLVVFGPADDPGAAQARAGIRGAPSDAASLADLARWTGGDMAVVSATAETAAEVDRLVGELRHRYLLTFEPGSRPGWHPIDVRTRRKNLTVRARGGYVAGPAARGGDQN